MIEEKIKNLTEEIRKYFLAQEINHTNRNVDVSFKGSTCIIYLSKMYEGLGDWVSYKNLNHLSKLLKTNNINLQNEFYAEGCESCDWGSLHKVDIVCSNIDLTEESLNQE